MHRIPIDGTLDLHSFHPSEVKDLLTEYLKECRVRSILQVRIIQGKGTGVLRQTVHAILEGHADVVSFAPAGEGGGGWGATIVQLRPGEAVH